MKVIGVTGHRPDKLGGYGPSPLQEKVRAALRAFFQHEQRRGSTELITGMALGVDQWAFEEAFAVGFGVRAYIPHQGQEKVWPQPVQQHYHALLAKAAEVRVVSPGPYQAWKMQTRNVAVVTDSAQMLAVFDGTPGGTHNCVTYAQYCKKPVTVINPRML